MSRTPDSISDLLAESRRLESEDDARSEAFAGKYHGGVDPRSARSTPWFLIFVLVMTLANLALTVVTWHNIHQSTEQTEDADEGQ